MNKRVIAIVGVILLTIGGGVAYLLRSPADKSTMQETRMESSQASDVPATSEQPAATAPGTYTDYTPTVIASTKDTKLLFFHAAWCPQCRALEADIKSKGVPDGVTIIKVDYDTNQALRQKYGVTLQTTLIKVDDAGTFVKKYVAYDSPTLDAVKTNLL